MVFDGEVCGTVEPAEAERADERMAGRMDLAELQEIAEKERAARKPVRIRVCTAAGCLSSGAHDVQKRLEEAVEHAGLGEQVEVCAVGCMRLCCEGPLVQVDPEGSLYERVSPDQAASIVAGLDGGAVTARRGDPGRPFFARQMSIVLENSGAIEPERIESYIAAGGYRVAPRSAARDDPGGGRRRGHPERPARPRRRGLSRPA